MKSSINLISLSLIFIIIIFIFIIRNFNKNEYLIKNIYNSQKYTYAKDLTLSINNKLYNSKNTETLDTIISTILENNYKIIFLNKKNKISIEGSYFRCYIYCELSDSIKINRINIQTTNKKYCEN